MNLEKRLEAQKTEETKSPKKEELRDSKSPKGKDTSKAKAIKQQNLESEKAKLRQDLEIMEQRQKLRKMIALNSNPKGFTDIEGFYRSDEVKRASSHPELVKERGWVTIKSPKIDPQDSEQRGRLRKIHSEEKNVLETQTEHRVTFEKPLSSVAEDRILKISTLKRSASPREEAQKVKQRQTDENASPESPKIPKQERTSPDQRIGISFSQSELSPSQQRAKLRALFTAGNSQGFDDNLLEPRVRPLPPEPSRKELSQEIHPEEKKDSELSPQEQREKLRSMYRKASTPRGFMDCEISPEKEPVEPLSLSDQREKIRSLYRTASNPRGFSETAPVPSHTREKDLSPSPEPILSASEQREKIRSLYRTASNPRGFSETINSSTPQEKPLTASEQREKLRLMINVNSNPKGLIDDVRTCEESLPVEKDLFVCLQL